MKTKTGKCHYVVGYKATLRDGRVYKNDEFIFSADDSTEYLANFKRRVLAIGDIKEVIFTDIKTLGY